MDKKFKAPTEEEVNEFLKESNAIEGEYGEVAFNDAKQAWTMACLCAEDFNQKNGVSYILGIHRRLMKRLNPGIAGKIRKVKVYVGNANGYRECLKPELIQEELSLLLNPGFYPTLSEEGIKKWHIQFEYIHEFCDGNGRTGRILMNIQRLRIGLPLLIIHEGAEQQEYYKWFKPNPKQQSL